MLSGTLQNDRSHWWLGAVAFLGMHALSISFSPGHTVEVSSFFLMFPPAFACLGAFFRAGNSEVASRRTWYLLAIACFVWTGALAVSIREQIVLKTPGDVGAGSQIVFFLYGVPVLLALCSLLDGRWGRYFVWMDGIQVALMGFLAYTIVFNVVPFTHQEVRPAAVSVVVLAFNIENLVLAIAATLRFIGAPVHGVQRRFYGSLSLFLWTYAACAALYNYQNGPTSLYDLVIDLPFLLLMVVSLSGYPLDRHLQGVHVRWLALVLDNGTPTLFPATVVALGAVIARNHFESGVACIAISLAVYGIRSTLVQVDYQRAQATTKAARDQMEKLSLTDELTQVPNRRHFEKSLEAEWNRATRQGSHLSLLMIDIDHFKFINDNFGHADGDICLRQVAHALQSSLQREFDTIARYGGEEFAAILPQTDRSGAEIVAARMRSIVANLKLRNRTPIGSTVTISIGVATREMHAPGSADLLTQASDRALYRAKKSGRDRTDFEPLPSEQVLIAEEAFAWEAT